MDDYTKNSVARSPCLEYKFSEFRKVHIDQKASVRGSDAYLKKALNARQTIEKAKLTVHHLNTCPAILYVL